MKNLLLFTLAFALYAFIQPTSLNAQQSRYEKAMLTQITTLDTARTMTTLQQLNNAFGRIAQAEKGEWLPVYYQSYCQMTMATIQMQKGNMNVCNAHLDQAQELLDLAKAKTDKNAEILALQGLIYQGRIWEDPMAMGAKFSPMSHAVLDEALEINPAHPRALYLKGQNVLYTPEFFGGGAANAQPILAKAEKAFAGFKPETEIHPNWGVRTCAYLLKKATEKLASDGTKQ